MTGIENQNWVKSLIEAQKLAKESLWNNNIEWAFKSRIKASNEILRGTAELNNDRIGVAKQMEAIQTWEKWKDTTKWIEDKLFSSFKDLPWFERKFKSLRPKDPEPLEEEFEWITTRGRWESSSGWPMTESWGRI